MPNYRTGNDEYYRKPKMNYKREYEPEEDGYEEDMMEERNYSKKPCICKVECPFKVIVKIIPCDDRKGSTSV